MTIYVHIHGMLTAGTRRTLFKGCMPVRRTITIDGPSLGRELAQQSGCSESMVQVI